MYIILKYWIGYRVKKILLKIKDTDVLDIQVGSSLGLKNINVINFSCRLWLFLII